MRLCRTGPDDLEDPSNLFQGKSSQLIPEKHIRVACHRLSYKLLSLTKSDCWGQASHFDRTGRLSTILAGQKTILLIKSSQTRGSFSLGPVNYMLEHFLKYYLAIHGRDWWVLSYWPLLVGPKGHSYYHLIHIHLKQSFRNSRAWMCSVCIYQISNLNLANII